MSKAPSTSAHSTREASGERSSLFVGSAEKTFRVLHAFDGPNRQMTLADLAKASSLDRSATQRIVHTLEVLGYLARVPETRDYRLTTKVLQFSYNYIRANELIDKASPYLLDISRHLGETTNLHEIDGTEVVFVARFPGRHLFNVDIALGARLPALYTASGIAILSRLPEKQLKAVIARTPLERMTPYTETDQKKLLERVHQASRRGYSVIENETVLGDIAVAAPITDHDGTAVAAVNISVPTTRWTIERVEAELVKHVQVAATSISKSRLPMSRR